MLLNTSKLQMFLLLLFCICIFSFKILYDRIWSGIEMPEVRKWKLVNRQNSCELRFDVKRDMVWLKKTCSWTPNKRWSTFKRRPVLKWSREIETSELKFPSLMSERVRYKEPWSSMWIQSFDSKNIKKSVYLEWRWTLKLHQRSCTQLQPFTKTVSSTCLPQESGA